MHTKPTPTPMTCLSSDTGEPSTSSLCRHPASHLALLENNLEAPIIETYSQYVYEQLTKFVLPSPFWKTFGDCLISDTDWYYGSTSRIWEISAIEPLLYRFRLGALEPYICEKGLFWYPTPTKNDANQVSFPPSQGAQRKRMGKVSLITQLMRDGLQPPANPVLWEWFMGFPPDWTNYEADELASWETLLTRDMKNKLISLSGGQSSAMLLKIMLDNGQVDEQTVVAFANTGKEDVGTIQFLREIKNRWCPGLIIVEYRPTAPFFQIVDFDNLSMKGEPFEALIKKRFYLPNKGKRICTYELKVLTLERLMKRHFKAKQFDTYMGIRFDEPERYFRHKDARKMPLYHMRVTKASRDNFWKNQPFRLEIHSQKGNCDLCFMKPLWLIHKLIRENPASADWWIEIEAAISAARKKKRNTTFLKGISYKNLKHSALNQTKLFDEGENFKTDCFCQDT